MLTLSHPSLQIVRGFAGAVLFSFPMLMTMEMWSLGVSLEPARLMLFVTVHLILLVGMASYARHDETIVTRKDALDAFAAYGVGVLAAARCCCCSGSSNWGCRRMPSVERLRFRPRQQVSEQWWRTSSSTSRQPAIGPGHPHGFANSAFLMAVGALYLCSSLASTEEMMLIAHKMSAWQIGGLMVFSLVMMQLFDEYAIEEDLGGAAGRIGMVSIARDDMHRLHHRPVDQPLYPLDVWPNRRADVHAAHQGNDRARVSGGIGRWRRATVVLKASDMAQTKKAVAHSSTQTGWLAALGMLFVLGSFTMLLRESFVAGRPVAEISRSGRRDSSVGARLPRQSQNQKFRQRHGGVAGRLKVC